MGKLLTALNAQLKTEHKADAEKCIIIYNELKGRSNGHVWESEWRVLVSTSFEGSYPNSKRISKPSSIGETFINGLSNN